MPKLDLRNATRIKAAGGELAALKGAGFSWTKPVTGETIGGARVGEPGASGTIYEGYTLSWGDEFNSLDILSPTNSRGRYFTTRTYLPGARGSDTLLGTMFDTDPFMTGHLDSNRGVPVGYDNMSAVASVLRLQARRATTEEKAHFSAGAAGGRQQVAAMISGPGAVHFYPGPENTGDVIYEARLRFSAAAGNPSGWHPTMWSQSLNPTIAIESDEMDWEGNADNIGFGYNRWTAGSGSGTAVGARIAHDGAWHIITMILSQGKIELYRDGVLHASSAVSANTKNKPQYPLFTNHIYNGTFEGDTYSKAEWDADADGALLEVDYCRIWRRTGRQHFKPLASLPDVNVNYGSSVTITLPSAVALWGDASVTEYLQVVYNEENEPGVTHSTVFTQLPPGVTYNSTTRELAVNITSGRTGRMNFVMSAWKNDGATGEPLRFAVNVGPNLTVTSLNFDAGSVVSYNLDAVCDCGVLTTDGTSRTKSVSVTGLPAGLSYSDATGFITGTAPATGVVASATVTITNSLGQTVADALEININEAVTGVTYDDWANLVGWFDASDSLTVSGSTATGMTNKVPGGGNLTAAGTAANRTRVLAAKNGLNILRLIRDVSGPTTTPRMESGTGISLTAPAEGSDQPFTLLLAYTPTDTNTGFPAAWSNNNGTEPQVVGLVRRAASASSVRRQLVLATSNDVNFGTGQPSGSARIVAIRHTGTAVTVWDTSIAPAITNMAQDVNALTAGKVFRIGSAIVGASGTQSVAGSLDFYEAAVSSAAETDDDVIVSIQALATKWGITLT